MTNFQVYRKTLLFSVLMFAINLLSFVLFIGFIVGGFFLFNALMNNGIIGLIVGLIIGLLSLILVQYLVINRIKAAQIGMMAIGVADGQLPEHTFKEGFALAKERFLKLTAFFFIMNSIKGVFRQIGRTVNRIGTAVGGQAGNTVTSVIDSAVQTLIAYLCDCCLGWVMYNRDRSMALCACEGAVIFFKHGKTLIRNIGRIFGMGILSFLLIGGGIFGISLLIFTAAPGILAPFVADLGGESSATIVAIVVSIGIALVLWPMIHSVVGRPFILVGVLRNFMLSGLKERPTESDFATLDSKSSKFAKLHQSA